MDEELRKLERLAEQDPALRPSYLQALKRSGNDAYPKELIRYSSDLVLEAIDCLIDQFTHTPQCVVLDHCNELSPHVIKDHLHPPNLLVAPNCRAYASSMVGQQGVIKERSMC